MSSKSKKTRRTSSVQVLNRHLLVFLWAMCTVLHPNPMQIRAVQEEIGNVLSSLRSGNLTEKMICEALAAEEDILTDWERRDRG